MKNGYLKGMVAGAIAGIADGIVSTLSSHLGKVIGIWKVVPGELTITYFLTQLFAMIEWNILWGILFGLAFVMVYDRIPGKGITKGLIFSLLFYFLLADVRTAQIMYPWRMLEGIDIMVKAFVFVGLFASIAFGAVLGYLYRK